MKILIDGYNLGLETGTGISTYARNLSHCIGSMGHHIDVLYGFNVYEPTFLDRLFGNNNELLSEISFFDQASNLSRWYEIYKVLGSFPNLFSSKTIAVPVSGSVIIENFGSRLPKFDRLLNSANLYKRADALFSIAPNYFSSQLRVKIADTPDIAHWTYPLPLQVVGAKNIYTLHDLVPLRLPFTTLDYKNRYLRLVSMLAKRADHIVTVSENSRRDIINLLGVPEHRVTNTYQAVQIPDKYANKTPDVIKNEIEGLLNLKYKDYLLFFGAIEPKKNIGRLIEAYLASNCPTPLVIVGKRAWKSEQELKLFDNINKLRTESYGSPKMIHLDYLPFNLLISLIKGAKIVLFPSLYEGFGLPVLEAMKLGTPVITSTGGSMREVVGGAALMVDPYDTHSLANAIKTLDQDENLRLELSAKGLRRAAEFSFEAYQKRLSKVYDGVLDTKIR